MPHEHLTEVHEVEERSHPRSIEGILAVCGDPLRIEVLLGEIPGEALDDRHTERDYAGHPGEHPLATPGGHPELAPQMDDHERHEQLDAPQVQAVEEVPDRVVVPPVGAAEGKRETRHHDDRQRGERGYAEHVDPRGHVGRLAVWKKLCRGQHTKSKTSHAGRPHPGCRGLRFGSGHHRVVVPDGVVSCGQSSIIELPARWSRERQDEGDAENHHHYGDQHQVGHRDREDRPVDVAAWAVQVHRAYDGRNQRDHVPTPRCRQVTDPSVQAFRLFNSDN